MLNKFNTNTYRSYSCYKAESWIFWTKDRITNDIIEIEIFAIIAAIKGSGLKFRDDLLKKDD